jgi:hypothetical protein
MEDALLGQSGPDDVGTEEEVQLSPDSVALYQCIAYTCAEESGTIPTLPPVSMAAKVLESSSPTLGTGVNGPVAGASVTLTGSTDAPLSYTTDAGGNFSGSFVPPSELPTFTGTKWGVTGTASVNQNITLYTDAVVKLGLSTDSAPAANSATFTVGGTLNGGAISGNMALGTGSPNLVIIPRNPAGGNSSLAVATIDHPRFTWFGEAASLGLSQATPAGTTASGAMRARAMHKWVKVQLNLSTNNGKPVPPDARAYAYTWDSVVYPAAGAGQPTYPASGLFGLPTAKDASLATVTQSNPAAAGVTALYVWTANRIANASAPYQSRFRLHIDSNEWRSQWENGAEDVVIDDAARINGLITKNLLLVPKNDAK